MSQEKRKTPFTPHEKERPLKPSETGGWLLALVLASVVAPRGAWADSLCAPTDSTYGCCLKRHPEDPGWCGGISECAPMGSPASGSGGASASSSVSTATVAMATGASGIVLSNDEWRELEMIEREVRAIVEKCVDEAHIQFIVEKLNNKIPSADKCNEAVGKDANGEPITRAMIWGAEKHELATRCVESRLTEKHKRHVSLKQRYRYDRAARRVEPISREEVEHLIRQKRHDELRGTLEPDLVFHTGNPTEILKIYDFKFPCPVSNHGRWRTYKGDHPYSGMTQKAIYEEAFKRQALRVVPYEGSIP